MTRTSGQVAGEQAARQKAERLELDRQRMLSGARHRPEDSSPRIRRLLGRDRPPRVPHVFESRLRIDGGYDSVDLGPADPGEGARS